MAKATKKFDKKRQLNYRKISIALVIAIFVILVLWFLEFKVNNNIYYRKKYLQKTSTKNIFLSKANP
ncbi:hypothetical protein HYU09_02615 [Candidatus Woesearchaeota archaeon]|nr:hypothetical protein [Candidatus Woesearchaeota archaeon]